MIPAGGATGAMVWKEFRETLKWAVLALVGTSAALFFVTREVMGFGSPAGSIRNESPLTDDKFLLVTTLCAAAAGLMFGLAQTLPERRRPDQWAFLVHRPVSRGRLFVAKVVTGLGLYLLAVGVPFACAVAWAATPGNMGAPFDPEMALPALADLLAGALYYFAGMVIGLREARWYGSRVLVIGLAGGCTAAVLFLPDFWHAAVVIAVGSAILGSAAWGLFKTGGTYARQPAAAKAGLAAAVCCGIGLLGIVAVGAVGEVLPKPDWDYVYSRYVIDASGKAVRVSQRGLSVAVTDPRGAPLPEYAAVSSDSIHSVFAALPETTLSLGRSTSNFVTYVFASYRRPTRFFLNLSFTEAERWYYVHDERYIVGYGTDNAQVIGYITPAGFHAGPDAPADRFTGELPRWASVHDQSMLAFSSDLYKLDVPGRRLVRAFTPPAGETLVSASRSSGPPAEAFDAIVTTGGLTVLGPDGAPRFSLPLEHGPADGYVQLNVAWRKGPGRYYLRFEPPFQWATPESPGVPQHVVEVTPAGEVAARHELPPLPGQAPPPPPRPGESVLVGVASPPVGMAAFFILAPWLQGEPTGLGGSGAADAEIRRAFLATLLSGLACAALTLALARRYAFGRGATVVWTASNFLLGPAGVLTMLAVREWPAREACPACGRRRVVDRERCPACAAPPALPAADGTEIFAV
jgi:hypothetical protein